MIQGAIAAAMEEILGGVVKNLPGPAISGAVRISIPLTVIEGKIELREGCDIDIDLNLCVGGSDTEDEGDMPF